MNDTSSSDSPSNNKNRIKAACLELENALELFNAPDPESEKRAVDETSKIKQIKNQLTDIRRQIDDLSK